MNNCIVTFFIVKFPRALFVQQIVRKPSVHLGCHRPLAYQLQSTTATRQLALAKMTDRRWKACLVGGAAAVVLAALGIRRKRQQEAEEANRPLSLFKVFMSRTVDKALLDTLHSGSFDAGGVQSR